MESIQLRVVRDQGVKQRHRVVDLEGNVTALLDPKFSVELGMLIEYPCVVPRRGRGVTIEGVTP